MKITADRDFGARECPACACSVPANHNHCPICGYDFPQSSPRQRQLKRAGAWIMLALFLLVMLGLARWLKF